MIERDSEVVLAQIYFNSYVVPPTQKGKWIGGSMAVE